MLLNSVYYLDSKIGRSRYDGYTMMKSLSLAFSVVCFGLSLTSCSPKVSSRKSVLVIAVESLGANVVTCPDDFRAPVATSGFNVFCEESVRFTKAYTPSLQSQAALSSVLTGLYPFEHGVRNNGSDFLSGQYQTLAEKALQKGYRTCFFSGGAPIWRKSGLSQGFEIFEDNISLTPDRLYRNSLENFDLFLSWLDREVHNEPWLCVLFVPDLQFVDTLLNTQDMNFDSFYEAQVKELDESLSFLHRELLLRRMWDSTTLVLVGLNGRSELNSERRLPPPARFYSSQTQVTLLVKPARKKRDLGLNWRIDRQVNLVDLGLTLLEIIGAEPPSSNWKELAPVVSLENTINDNNVDIDDNRWILTESSWSAWQGYTASSRLALRKGPFLVLPGLRWKIYNTLLDPLETHSLSLVDSSAALEIRDEAMELLSKLRPLQFEEETSAAFMESANYDNFLASRQVVMAELGLFEFSNNFFSPANLRNIFYRHVGDSALAGRLASFLLSRKDWSALKVLGELVNNESWKIVAHRNLGLNYRGQYGACLSYFEPDARMRFQGKVPARLCEDREFSYLVSLAWQGDLKRSRALEPAAQQLRFRAISQQAGRLNYLGYLNWSVSPAIPEAPSYSELFLALPENAEIKRALSQP